MSSKYPWRDKNGPTPEKPKEAKVTASKSKLEPIKSKMTDWQGLWYHPELHYYTSAVFDLSELRKYKGKVRIRVVKNKFYNKGKNGRPYYVFTIADASSENALELQITDHDFEEKCEEERLYTRDEVQYAINRAAEDGIRGYGPGDNIVEDYLD